MMNYDEQEEEEQKKKEEYVISAFQTMLKKQS